MYFCLALFSILGTALAASRETAPAGALVVRKSPASGEYATIQAAVNALSTTSSSAQAIFINPGSYNEQVYVAPRTAALTIYGYTSDVSSYGSNTVNITYGLSQLDVASDDLTATVRAHSSNFKMYNINMINSHGSGSQALALSASAANQAYYACQFRGFQDTVLSNTGAQLFAKSLIVGATDFIFGLQAMSWFEKCDIRVLAASLGYITANGRASASETGIYVINNSTVAAAAGNSVPNGAYYLGRPWRDYARVVYQDTSLSAVINAAGWHIWDTSDPRTDHVTFEEYDNTGAGASGTRASFSTKLSKPVTIESVLGSGYSTASWVDTSYL